MNDKTIIDLIKLIRYLKFYFGTIKIFYRNFRSLNFQITRRMREIGLAIFARHTIFISSL